jgi:hypothetical protein
MVVNLPLRYFMMPTKTCGNSCLVQAKGYVTLVLGCDDNEKGFAQEAQLPASASSGGNCHISLRHKLWHVALSD